MRDFRHNQRRAAARGFGWEESFPSRPGHHEHGHHGEPPYPPEPPFPPEGPFPPPGPGGFPGFPGRPPFGGPGFPPPWAAGWGGWGHGGPGGRGGGRRHGGRGRGGRARRGNVRAAILTLLVERPMHGYEMIQEIAERSGGIWRPSPGSVYPTLQLLADEGLVSAEEGTSGKRLFTLTDAGRAEAEKLDKTPPWSQDSFDVDPKDIDLRSALGQLATAVFQVAQAASTEQKARAVKAITDARSELYLLLAETGVSTEDDDSAAEDEPDSE